MPARRAASAHVRVSEHADRYEFEILTLLQTRKAPPAAVVLFGRDYWSRAVGWDALAEHGLVDAQDLALFRIVEEPEEAWDWLVGHGLTAHTPREEAPMTGW